ncbi:hypothetical protein ACLOJK_023097 [Asimina triloba]
MEPAGSASLLLLGLVEEEDIVGSELISTYCRSEMEKTDAFMAWTVKRLSVTTAVGGFGLLSSSPCFWAVPITRSDIRRKVVDGSHGCRL